MSDTVEERITAMEKLLKEHDDVLFGKWDIAQTTRTPGILERIVSIGDQIKLITQIMKYGVLPIMVMDTLQRFGLGNLLPAVLKLIPLVVH
jgi:hypothetical protein